MASTFLRNTLGRSLTRLTLAVSARNDPIIANLTRRHIHRNKALLATINLEMPSLSPTMTEGTIVKWHKKEGDTINPGDVLCDIQTDKAVVSFDTEEEGILAKIILPENSSDVKIGTLIALMVEEGDDWQSVIVPGTEAAAPPPAPPPPAPTPTSAAAPAAEPFRGTQITMPSLSPTMTEGTIVKWHKKEGDVINPGDLLCDIQTDKAVVSMDLEEEGILAKILMPEGSADVKIGKLIALIVEEGEDWQNVTIPGEGAADSAPAPAPAAAPAGEPFRGTKVTMPSLSPTMTEGTIVKWHKKEGDEINPGDLLCDIQTDKAVVSMDIEEEGILAKILMPEGSTEVMIGKLIALIVEEGEDWQNVTIPVEGAEGSAPAAPAAAVPPPPPPPAAPIAAPVIESVDVEEIHSLTGVGPSVKKLLEEYHISPKEIHPTGPKGHLLKGDVLSMIKSKHLHKFDLVHPPVADPQPTAPAVPARAPTKPAPPSRPPPPAAAAFIDIPTTSMRKTIAKRLTESKTTIPHCYGSVACNVGNAVKLRKQLIGEGIKVSMNDFIIKAAALALERVPQMNATVQGGTPVLSDSVDISIAVATPNGLITPIVQSAAKLGIAEISSKVKELAGRAREGKLQLHEFQGGSFSISNLGMFGITEFTAVINPPQAAILAIGTSRLIPGIVGPVNMMTVTLSYDRRAVDEHEAAKFLEVFREIMENPLTIISGSNPLTVAAPPPPIPVSTAPAASTPVSAASAASAPVLTAPVSAAPVTAAPVTAAPVESAPVESAPVESAPVVADPVPNEPAPSLLQNAEALAREAFIKSLMT